jgi:Fur family transcriptional regulator, ferric uptake regulator
MIKKRNTPTKQAVLSVLQTADKALSPEDIEKAVEREIDRVTIYRVLNGFCDDGLAHRIIADDGRQYFAFCAGCSGGQHFHDHYHFRCLGCQKLECLNQQVSVSLPMGYRLEQVNCILTGYCAGCALPG